jgi:hypothetical protein
MNNQQLSSKLEGIDKVVVAIHGIGSQTRSSTIREVVRQFGDHQKKPLPLLPLGYFHFEPGINSLVSRLSEDHSDPLSRIGFVEVFWADIPEGIVKQNDTLEETKAWGKTIVSRAQALYESKERHEVTRLVPGDFSLAAGVVEEVVEAMAVLENLFFLADKAGIFRFDLAALLRDYVDDVQVVAEFEPFRREIVLRFHKTLAAIDRIFRECQCALPEIYVVAHSEGTVVSFLGLLEALSGMPIQDPQAAAGQSATVDTTWINRVRGYMTIGSPIDKHLVLWPRLWEEVRDKLRATAVAPKRIQWRNYYDHGDPIGFELDTAREFLRQHGCMAFEFEEKHDFGFSRYPLPGKAHNDYWNDAVVFGHFIDDVVSPASQPPRAPKTKPWSRTVSIVLPYVLVYLLHIAAVYALFKGIASSMDRPPTLAAVAVELIALAAFFNGVTIAARVPRLSKAWAPRARSLITLIGIGGASLWCLRSVATYVGEAIATVVKSSVSFPFVGQATIAAIGALIVLTGWRAPRKPRWGRRLLIGVGTFLVAVIVAANFKPSADTPFWPVILGAAGFMYLWWLGILMFDLTFIWHRYIRQAMGMRSLRRWSPYAGAPHVGPT